MQEISEELRRVCEESFHILWGDYVMHPVLPGTEGAEDAFLPGRPCAVWYEAVYEAKKAMVEAYGNCEADLEIICRNYEAIAEYIGKRMFAQGAYAAQLLAEAPPSR